MMMAMKMEIMIIKSFSLMKVMSLWIVTFGDISLAAAGLMEK
jgi:hypothetical protein